MTNQEAIKILGQYDVSDLHFYTTNGEEIPFTEWSDAIELAISALEKQDVPDINVGDMISRRSAIDAAEKESQVDGAYGYMDTKSIVDLLNDLPSVQPTLYGYNVEHLILIAEVLRKENMPPERVAEALTDIERIVDIVRDEFEKSFRKAVEQCMT